MLSGCNLDDLLDLGKRCSGRRDRLAVDRADVGASRHDESGIARRAVGLLPERGDALASGKDSERHRR